MAGPEFLATDIPPLWGGINLAVLWLPTFRPYGTGLCEARSGYRHFVPTGRGYARLGVATDISSLRDGDDIRNFRRENVPIMFPIAIRILVGIGVLGHIRAFLQGDMSPHCIAASCRRTPYSS